MLLSLFCPNTVISAEALRRDTKHCGLKAVPLIPDCVSTVTLWKEHGTMLRALACSIQICEVPQVWRSWQTLCLRQYSLPFLLLWLPCRAVWKQRQIVCEGWSAMWCRRCETSVMYREQPLTPGCTHRYWRLTLESCGSAKSVHQKTSEQKHIYLVGHLRAAALIFINMFSERYHFVLILSYILLILVIVLATQQQLYRHSCHFFSESLCFCNSLHFCVVMQTYPTF